MIHTRYISRGARPDYTPPGRDSAPVINALIQAAISAGRKEYVLPSGISYYSSPIVIPKGTSDFTLRGQPDGSTKLVADAQITTDGLISIGRNNNDVAEVWATSGSGVRTAVDAVFQGQPTLATTDSEEPFEVGKWYALADLDMIPDLSTGSEVLFKYRAEMVKCIAWDDDSNIATLEQAVRRDYNVSPQVLHLEVDGQDPRLCHNITLKDFHVSGEVVENVTYSFFGIWALFVRGLTIENLFVERFDDSLIRCDLCSDVRMRSIALENDDSQITQVDWERGINLFWCTGIELRDVTAHQLRHGVQFAQGNQDFVLDGYVATASKDDSPDCHGARNIRGRIANFITDTSCKVGNASYPAGDQEITIENGVCEYYLRVQGGSKVKAVNVSARALNLLNTQGFPEYYPHDCEYVSCTFENPVTSNTNNNLTSDMFDYSGDFVRRFSGQKFKWCTFVQNRTTDANWCVFLTLITDDSDASFEECSFTNKDAFELIKNELQVSSSEVVLAFDTCTFDSIENVQFAFLFKEASYGQCSIGNSTFITDFGPNPPPEFADNESSSFNVLEAGNTIHSH